MIIEKTVTEEIVSRGEIAIAELSVQLADIAKRITDAQTEIAAIPQGRDNRARELEEARACQSRAESIHSQAVAYGKLAQDTVNEQQSIRAVSSAKKALNTASKDLAQLEATSAEAEQLATNRETELCASLVQIKSDQERLQSELRHTRAAHLQSHQALGVQKRDAIIAAYTERQSRIDDLKSHLVEAQTDQLDFYEQAMSDLADWPDLQREIRNLRPVDDHTTRVVIATMRYIDTLTADMPQSPWDILDTLTIPTQELRGSQGRLQERQKKIQQILDAYQQYCTGN